MHEEQFAIGLPDDDVIHHGEIFRGPHRHALGLRQRIRLRTESGGGQQGCDEKLS
jgi:hypothetical protein